MNVTHTNVDSVNAIIQINIDKADYQEKTEKALKTFRQKANIPGFRPGTVPMGMVKKMYGKSIIADEINKLIGESLYGYIQDSKLNVLGEPLPNEDKQQPIDFATEGDYEFFFDVALAPEIKLDLTKKDKIDYYKIDVDDELVNKQIDSFKSNYGKYEKVDEDAKETDLLKGEITELEDGKPKKGGIIVEAGVLMPSYVKNETEQAKFVGAKTGQVITFNPGIAYDGNEAEIASLLQIKKEEIESLSPEFSFNVKEITRYQEAALDQALFDRVVGENTVTTEEEFKAKLKESIAQQLAPDSDYKFLLDARELLEKKVGNLVFPDTFLKRWLLATSKDKDKEKTPESVEADYPKIIEDLRFHLVKEQIVKDHNLKVEEAEVKQAAMQAARAQFAQYGMMSLPDDMVENYANEMLKNKDTARNLVDKAMEARLIECLKSILGVVEKPIALDDFKKFFEGEED